MKEFMGDSEKESMKIELAVQKAVAMIMEHVVEKDADPE